MRIVPLAMRRSHTWNRRNWYYILACHPVVSRDSFNCVLIGHTTISIELVRGIMQWTGVDEGRKR